MQNFPVSTFKLNQNLYKFVYFYYVTSFLAIVFCGFVLYWTFTDSKWLIFILFLFLSYLMTARFWYCHIALNYKVKIEGQTLTEYVFNKPTKTVDLFNVKSVQPRTQSLPVFSHWWAIIDDDFDFQGYANYKGLALSMNDGSLNYCPIFDLGDEFLNNLSLNFNLKVVLNTPDKMATQANRAVSYGMIVLIIGLFIWIIINAIKINFFI